MIKIFNLKGIAILSAVFIVVQVVSALVISPVLTPVIVDTLNKQVGTKISVSKVTVWPLTLSCSLRDLKVFDPDNEEERIALIRHASIRLSPLGLLSKRVVISRINVSGAEITLRGEPDGSFNVEKLARPKGRKPTQKVGLFDRLKKEKDWFSRIYNVVKSRSSKEVIEKKTTESKKTERKIVALPRGRTVQFIKPRDNYVFEIKQLAVKNSLFNLETDTAETVQVEKTSLRIENLGLDPAAGARFDKLGVKGTLRKDDKACGSFNMDYAQSYRQGRQSITFKLSAKDVDLKAIRFIYQDSLPVRFESGVISINSNTKILNGALDSNNSLTLADHNIIPNSKGQILGFVTMPVVCEALNKIKPLKMEFEITGSVDKPQFKGFEEILLKTIKPYMADVSDNFKKQGLDALGDFFKKK